MDTRFLESFLVVAEQGSIANAARLLSITPAAVSQRLRALEKDIGCQLVIRAGRTVTPTPSGYAILQSAQEVTRRARDLVSLAAASPDEGELRLGVTATALTGMLPNLVGTLAERYPKIELYIRPSSSIDLYPRVLSGEIDVAIMVKPRFAVPKSHGWLTLRKEPLILLTPSRMVVDDPHRVIEREPFIQYDRGHWGGQIVDNYVRRHNLRITTRLEIDALDAIAVLVDRHLGVAIVPDWAPPWPENLHIRKVPLRGIQADTRQIGVMWTKSGPRFAIVRAFLDACETSLGDFRQ